ncbi:unnamed protein product [Rhodiola kirilowii]
MAGSVPLDPDLIVAHQFPDTAYTYNERDAVVYALGVGACAKDALDESELKYVYHPDGQQSVQVLPTFAALLSLGSIRSISSLPGLNYDPRFLLHGQQYIEIYKPLPSSGHIHNKACVAGLHDKGKAAVLEIETTSYEKASGVLLCRNRLTLFLRGAGGFSKSSKPYSFSKYQVTPTAAATIPQHQPTAVLEECTHPSQALLYRLSGDYNPLHSDSAVAKLGGFSGPILHGLCTLGFAIRAVIKCICSGDPNLIRSISARFLLHVFPGETLVTKMWHQGPRVIYQTSVKERNSVVLSGLVDLKPTSPL